MSRIKTPTNQIKLTNVAVVRLRKNALRFELACFRNKVMSFRQGLEKDLDEVLQIHTIFSNVSKGLVSSKADLEAAFPDMKEEDIILEILRKGEQQVSKEERDSQLDQTFKEVATIISDKCINPDTKRPYTISQIERAMHDIHISIQPSKSTKKQALEVMKLLKEHVPLERASMSVRIVLPKKEAKQVQANLKELLGAIESQDWQGDILEIVSSIDPGNYRPIDEMVRAQTRGQGSVDILSVKNVEGGDQEI
eukprot:m.55708 g.55708  ORF g.55708 m.55708 type:complete len:252 (-) comp13336_c0_seq4:723-1478(-)